MNNLPDVTTHDRHETIPINPAILYVGTPVVLVTTVSEDGRVGVNALWPRTVIDTAAMVELADHLSMRALRSPEIVADAAWLTLTSDARTNTGNFFIDDELLATQGGPTSRAMGHRVWQT